MPVAATTKDRQARSQFAFDKEGNHDADRSPDPVAGGLPKSRLRGVVEQAERNQAFEERRKIECKPVGRQVNR